MALRNLVIPALCLLAGVAIGAFVVPGPYSYGESKGMHYRVNRLTGVEQYASSRGWVSEQEMVGDSMRSFFGGMASAVQGQGEPMARPSNGPRGE